MNMQTRRQDYSYKTETPLLYTVINFIILNPHSKKKKKKKDAKSASLNFIKYEV